MTQTILHHKYSIQELSNGWTLYINDWKEGEAEPMVFALYAKDMDGIYKIISHYQATGNIEGL